VKPFRKTRSWRSDETDARGTNRDHPLKKGNQMQHQFIVCLIIACTMSIFRPAQTQAADPDIWYQNNTGKDAYDFHMSISLKKEPKPGDWKTNPWGAPTITESDELGGGFDFTWAGETAIKDKGKITLIGKKLAHGVIAGTAGIIDSAYWTDKDHKAISDSVSPMPESMPAWAQAAALGVVCLVGRACGRKRPLNTAEPRNQPD
jgi:hypothetical protein